MAMSATLLRQGRYSLGTAYILLAIPATRTLLEVTMVGHMLLQIPLLILIGIGLCHVLPEHCKDSLLSTVGGAWPCVLLALFVSSYWMLPRALDASLNNPLLETAKFVSIPALIGLPLALAWKQLEAIGRGFVWTNLISMLAVLGWLYIAAPARVCNNYLLDQQELTGWWMVKLALLLFACWLGSLFVGGNPASDAQRPATANTHSTQTKPA